MADVRELLDRSHADPLTDAVTTCGTTSLRWLEINASGEINGPLFDAGGVVYNVKHPAYGAKGDGGTNDAAAFQAAHDALPADGGTIVIPPVATYYKISSQVAFTKPVILLGMDWYCSELLTDTNALTMITTTAKLVLKNINFTASGAAIGTANAVKTLSTAASHGETFLFHCYFASFDRCYWSERTTSLHVAECRFSPSAGYGLYLENTTDPDEGDSFIHDNSFAAGAGDVPIYVASTSGINISGNKFNGAATVHVDIAPTTNDVGNFLFANNSFEGHTTAGIRLIATTGSIQKSVIVGNQFSSSGATHIIVGNKANNTVISGNVLNDTIATNGIGVDIQTGAQNVAITDNLFYQIQTAINSTATITGQTIEGNRYALVNNGTLEVTDFYLAGENDNNLSGPGSTKDFDVDRYVTNSSNASYINAFQLKGDCMAEVFVTGIVQGAGNASKYRKVLISNDTTVTDLIAEVATGSTFDMQIAASSGYTVIGIKRNGATGTSADMQVRARVTGYVRDFSKV